MRTYFFFTSNSLLDLNSLYALTPFIFIADALGGHCKIFPINPFILFLIFFSDGIFLDILYACRTVPKLISAIGFPYLSKGNYLFRFGKNIFRFKKDNLSFGYCKISFGKCKSYNHITI